MVGKKKTMIMVRYVVPAIRIALGTVFIVSGATKLCNLNSFAETIMEFGYIPDVLSSPIALAVSITELIAGILLLSGLFVRNASIFVTVLLALFVLMSIPHVLLGDSMECGCFGDFMQSEVDASLLLRNLLLIIMSVIVSMQRVNCFALENCFGRH